MSDNMYLKLAIENSRRSMQDGNFPAGAIVVKDGQVLSSDVSSRYPGLFHADSKAVTTAFNTYGILTEAILYIALQSCLMCTSVAYWAGIRRIVYAVPKIKVLPTYYETPEDTSQLIKTFNEKIEFIQIRESEAEAFEIIREWENKIL